MWLFLKKSRTSPNLTVQSRSENALCLTLWFSGQQVDVLRHHHIPIDAETEAASDALQRSLERLPACVRHEQWTAMIATERNQVGGFLKSLQSPRREVGLSPATSPRKPKQGLNGPPALR
jgi:hypothetical protein